ncbi:hypothetical protein [Ferdinandcohnia sp. Marseille-Q9671]
MRVKDWFRMVVAFSILLVMGCSNNVGEETEEFPPSMSGVITIDETEYQMKSGAFRWERKKGLETEVVTTDHASPYQMAENIEPISASPNQKAEMKIEDNPTTHVYLWNEEGRGEEIGMEANQLTLPSSEGKYIYEVVAEWPNGTISYTFVVDIQ